MLHIRWVCRRLWYMAMTYGVAQRGRCLPVVAAQAAARPTIAALPHREGGTSTESCPWRQYAVGDVAAPRQLSQLALHGGHDYGWGHSPPTRGVTMYTQPMALRGDGNRR